MTEIAVDIIEALIERLRAIGISVASPSINIDNKSAADNKDCTEYSMYVCCPVDNTYPAVGVSLIRSTYFPASSASWDLEDFHGNVLQVPEAYNRQAHACLKIEKQIYYNVD